MTKIEWADKTWNPVVGCSIVSPGCTHCYAMRQAARIERMQNTAFDATVARKYSPYAGTTQTTKAGAVWTGKVAMASDDALTAPLRRRKPTAWFVNSMGDLFHESVPDAWIDRVFAVMALAPQHTFIVLTKRSKRMQRYCADLKRSAYVYDAMSNLPDAEKRGIKEIRAAYDLVMDWPLPNVILGVSCERQQEADERIPDLLATPAAKRIVSVEPLLGAIDLTGDGREGPLANGEPTLAQIDGPNGTYFIRHGASRIDGVIVGGESGAGARPMHPDWARSIRDQCAAANVPFFFKQCGKRAAGRLLDGRTHDDLPWSVA